MEDRAELTKNLASSPIGEGDLNLAFYNACALLQVRDYFVDARFQEFASLRASLRVQDKTIVARVSDGFKAASQDVITGLAVYLVSKAFRKCLGYSEEGFIASYKEFVSKKSVSNLSDSLRRLRGRKRRATPNGNAYDLRTRLAAVAAAYPEVFQGVVLPEVGWSKEKSRRRLGYHDSAINRIIVSRLLDSPSVPEYVVDYIVFHELLHSKHEVLFQRGESLRRTVHPKAFKQDERRFNQFNEATQWIEKLRWLR